MKTDCCFLYLEDGTYYCGQFFGKIPPLVNELSLYDKQVPAGELVFNTGMTGYQAIFTDPSYTGQLIVMTYPHIGNYGTNPEWNESEPEEEKKYAVKMQGVIVRNLYLGPVPHQRKTLDVFLKENSVSGIWGLDTRTLTLKIRNEGNCNAVIVRAKNNESLSAYEISHLQDFLKSFPKMEGRNLVAEVGTKRPLVFNPQGNPHICLIDCGLKANILRELIKRNSKVTVVPSSYRAQDILDLHPEGILFSNGPGDPAVLETLIKCARELIGKKPLFGICLGHQIISLALGAKTYKMKFGHHGVNHPVRDERSKRVLITSQNHGFAVAEENLPPQIEVLFRNCNDNTVEGIIHQKLHLLTAQFHPEAAPGPYDAKWIFDDFLKLIF